MDELLGLFEFEVDFNRQRIQDFNRLFQIEFVEKFSSKCLGGFEGTNNSEFVKKCFMQPFLYKMCVFERFVHNDVEDHIS